MGQPKEKKPVVRWLWASSNGVLSNGLYTEFELEANGLSRHFPIKLEWSRTEFPE